MLFSRYVVGMFSEHDKDDVFTNHDMLWRPFEQRTRSRFHIF